MADAVQAVHGVVIPYAAAADLVAVIDDLARLAAPRVLPRRVVFLRHRLIECCTHATASVEGSAEVVASLDPLPLDSEAIVDTATAAERLGMTRNGVTWHCRRGQLEGTRVGRQWWVSVESIELYELMKGRSA